MQITTIELNAPATEMEKVIVVSIIIAVYNAADHIHGCLASIAEQSFKSIEVVVIDGGSSDGTHAIVQEFKALNIVWQSEPDAGIYDAMNKGTKLAAGKWFHFLGADDRLLPDFSELAGKLTDQQSVYYGYSKPYYHTGIKPPYEILTGKFSKYRLAKVCMNHQAIIYPASVFKKYHYEPRYKIFADYALNIMVWGDAGFKRYYYPLAVVRYNMNGFSSSNKDELFQHDKPGLIKKGMGWAIWLRYRFKQYKEKLKGKQ